MTTTASTKPWGDITDADYASAEEYCNSCLIDLNEPDKPKSKDACKLPVREPGGQLNRGGMASAAAVLAGARGGVDAPAAAKRSAARKLAAAYAQCGMDAPESLRQMAG